MIRLGKLTDYAVVVLSQLAQDDADHARSAAWLADQTGLPEPTVSKVLKKLAQEKLLVSQRGVAGGYRLAVSPARITMRRVVEAMEGPIALAACVEGADEECKIQSACPARGKWTPLNRAICAAFESVTLADMAGGGQTAPVTQLIQITGAANAGLK